MTASRDDLPWVDGVTIGEEIQAWLGDVWARTEAAVILLGGDGREPLARRPVLAEIYDDEALVDLRGLTTTGSFLNDICRCPGSWTVALLDAAGEFIGSGSVHGTDVAWERGRFRNNLEVADPERLRSFLDRYDVFRR